MEWLANTAVDEDFPEKVFYLCSANSIENLSDTTSPSTANFGLFVAMNANGVTNDIILQGAKKLLSRGLASLCTWGPDCERVHDLFDVAARDINSEPTDNDVVMTTWHSGVSISLWWKS